MSQYFSLGVQGVSDQDKAKAVVFQIDSALSGFHPTAEKLAGLLRHRARRPLFLIDLAVPRDFEPAINLLDDVYLYDIDDLQSIAQSHLRNRQTEIVRSVEILKPHVERYLHWASRQGDSPGPDHRIPA